MNFLAHNKRINCIQRSILALMCGLAPIAVVILGDAQGCGRLARVGRSNVGTTLALTPTSVLAKI